MRPSGEIASKLKSPFSVMWRRRSSRRASTIAKVVRLRGKRVRGLIRTSVRPSAESPLGEPS